MYCLTSVNLLRKYSWVVDVPMSWLLCSTVYLASPSQWLQVGRKLNIELDLQSLFGHHVLLDVQLHNVQLQNVHLPDVQLQNVQITKRPDYQTSFLPDVQITKPPVTERPVTKRPH